MVFCRASVEEATSLKAILNSYALVSGQVINFEKSAMTFSKWTNADKKEQINQILGIQLVEKHDRYLGMPAVVGNRRKRSLVFCGIKFGGEYTDGEKKHFPELVERCLLRRCYNQF